MEHYVTLFDHRFLPQGLALHSSLERHAGPYVLWILCLDDVTYDVLRRVRLANVRLMRLADVETADLRRVKGERSRMEYCWTLTPFAPRFVFEADPTVQRATYVDADLWFCQSPAPIFRELEQSQKQVLITEHAYAPQYDQTTMSGRFCVQFITFTRSGESVRKWWEERCIEWCFVRREDGKFGDQKYLDDWPTRFGDKVHVLPRTEWTCAPWNAEVAPLEQALFFHFHGLRLLAGHRVSLGDYPVSPALFERIYSPYLDCLASAIRALRGVGFEPQPQQHRDAAFMLKRAVLSLLGRRRPEVVVPMKAF
jgi:hypothetical protein